MKKIYVFALYAFFGLVVSSPVFADSSLSEESIRTFYAQSMTAQKSGIDKTTAFLDKHTHENATTVINAITHMQGAPKNEQTMTLNKKELLAKTYQGRSAMDLKDIKNNILSLTISEDGQKAVVKDSTYSTLILTMPGTGAQKARFDVEQSMLCDTELTIETGIIQVKNNICNSEVSIKPLTK